MTRALIIKQLKRLEAYYENMHEYQPSMESEYQAGLQIFPIVFKEHISKQDAQHIIQIFNTTNQTKHHNGLGWFELRVFIIKMLNSHNILVCASEEGEIEFC